MEIDELILKFTSQFDKVKNDVDNLISKFTKLDNTSSKVSNDFEKISKSATDMGNGFKNSEKNIQDLENRLNYLKGQFKEHVSIYKQWGDLATTKTPDSIKGLAGEDLRKAFGEPITRDSLLKEREEIDKLQAKIGELKEKISSTPKLKVVPKTDEGEKNLEKVGNKSDETGRKFDKLKNKTSSLSFGFSKIGKGFGELKGIFGVHNLFMSFPNIFKR